MKTKIIFTVAIALLFTYSLEVSSQIRAVTETGDTIFVYDNGTWSFEMEEQAPEASEFDFLDVQLLIDTLDTEQHFPASAKRKLKTHAISLRSNTMVQFGLGYHLPH